MDAASILNSGGVQVVPTAAEVATSTVSIPTGSGVVSTASLTISTASPIFTTATESTPYTRRKDKETMVEFETPKKKKVQEKIDVQLARELEEEMARYTQRMNKQIAGDAEIARIHAEEELQIMIDGLDRNNETVTNDSTPRVTSLAADEGSMQKKLDELMDLCTSLQRQQSKMVSKFESQELEINSLKAKIKLLEDKDQGVAEKSGDDAPIKRKRVDEREEATERVSD
nr:hypothetical protein [Tanacetum cinerariifolium]